MANGREPLLKRAIVRRTLLGSCNFKYFYVDTEVLCNLYVRSLFPFKLFESLKISCKNSSLSTTFRRSRIIRIADFVDIVQSFTMSAASILRTKPFTLKHHPLRLFAVQAAIFLVSLFSSDLSILHNKRMQAVLCFV